MTKNIGPLNREMPTFAEIELNGNPIVHYMDVIDLPKGEKRKACAQHLEEGVASEILGEFVLLGCHFPDPNEEQIIRTAFVCPGPSTFKKSCRMRLFQATANGDVVTEEKIS